MSYLVPLPHGLPHIGFKKIGGGEGCFLFKQKLKQYGDYIEKLSFKVFSNGILSKNRLMDWSL